MALFRDRVFSLRQLQYVVAVWDVGGFGRAASVCGVSQPSLSAAVSKVEEMLGVQLFERLPRSVVLTPEGRALLPQMRELLRASEQLEQRASALASPGSVTVRIGVIPTVAPYLLPAWCRALAASSPQLTVHWLEGQTARLEALLAEGEIDGAVIADAPSGAGTEARVLARDPFVVLVAQGHPMAGPVDAAKLSAQKLLLLEDGHCLRDHALSLCLLPGVAESPFRATSLATLVQMVGAGLGVTVLPGCAVDVEASRAPVRVLPLVAPAPERLIQLVWRRSAPHATTLQAVARCLAAT